MVADLRSRRGFNPRLRTGGDLRVPYRKRGCKVSIHASAREATRVAGSITGSNLVSIHASAREATVTGVGLRG